RGRRNRMVSREDAIGGIALVAPKDLIATVARQQVADPALAGELGAREGADGPVGPGRLITGPDETGQHGPGLVGAQDLDIVSCLEVAGCQLRVSQFVVPGLTEADRKGIDPIVGDSAHETHDGTAVRPTAEEGAGFLGCGAIERTADGLLRKA